MGLISGMFYTTRYETKRHPLSGHGLPANKKLVHAFCVFDPSLPEKEDVICAIADYLRRF